ncbi:MAG: restriction endonuclease subunit S [Alloprevotella sp.]
MPKYTNRLKHKSHYENVPQGWCGCLLGEICQIQSSKRVHKNDYVEKGVPFYRTTEIKELSEGKTISNCLFISDTQYSLIKEKYGVPHKGDILISAVGTIGITYVIPNEDHFYFKDGNLIWIGKSNSVNSDYLCMMLGHMVRNSNAISTSGSAYNALTIEKLTELEILLPPLTEQNRIIEELNKWYSAIEIIENGEVSLLDTIQNVKSKILNLAIHGKLVPQDPNDEPAIELLKRINPKFVPCDNAHYENVPSNWALARVEDIGQLLSGRDLTNDECNSENIGLPYLIGASNIEGNTFSFIRWTEKPQVISQIGDILISCKGTIGAIVKNDIGDIHIARQFMAIRPNTDGITSDYLHICMIAVVEEIKKDARGVIPGIARDNILTKVFAIPPINEQRRIIAAINQYHSILDNISAEL